MKRAGTRLMERANSELALQSCHHADRSRRAPALLASPRKKMRLGVNRT
jgi:hypothetical protein